MGAGAAGAVRLAGGMEVEREAMAAAPLTMGTAVATTSGDLAARGVRVIFHAVVSDRLGAPTREDIVQQATTDLLRLADRQRVRALALPPIGAGLGPGRLPTARVWELMIEEIVAYLRRFTSRLERIILVTRFPDEAEEVTRLLRVAREHWWGLR
jgi:O-acetyl-ADP-ribose deacetylase (regulator of RNase III)